MTQDPRLTRVAVEHRGWERLTAEELARDCALPGGYDYVAARITLRVGSALTDVGLTALFSRTLRTPGSAAT